MFCCLHLSVSCELPTVSVCGLQRGRGLSRGRDFAATRYTHYTLLKGYEHKYVAAQTSMFLRIILMDLFTGIQIFSLLSLLG